MKTKLSFAIALMLASGAFSQTGHYVMPGGRTGINTTVPNNRLEINSFTGDPYFGSSSGSSGLRLTRLTSANTPLTNPTNGVLSVDANGDVILVADQAGSGVFGGAQNGCSVGSTGKVELGNAPAGTSAMLTGDREIPQNNHLIHFSGIQPMDRVHIGGTNGIIQGWGGRLSVENRVPVSSSATDAIGISLFSDAYAPIHNYGMKFNLLDKSNTLFANANVGIHGQTEGLGNQIAFSGYALGKGAGTMTGMFINCSTQATGSGDAIGVDCFISNNGNSNITYGIRTDVAHARVTNYGASFSCGNGGTSNYGVKAVATSASFQGTAINYGIMAVAEYGQQNIAVFGHSKSLVGTNNLAGLFEGNVEINGFLPAGPYALTVNGNAFTTGSQWFFSDSRLKQNVVPLSNVMERISRLNAYNYTYRIHDFPEFNFSEGNQIGFIAQELKEVFPELVKETKEGYLSVNYSQFVPVLLQAVKEQQNQIDELKKILTSNQNLTKLSAPNGMPSTSGNLNDMIVLDQNVPNPFAESTTIGYSLPAKFVKAQMFFSTVDGRILKVVDLETAGDGAVTVYADDLSNGTYQYSLVVDDKTVVTKKMIKQ